MRAVVISRPPARRWLLVLGTSVASCGGQARGGLMPFDASDGSHDATLESDGAAESDSRACAETRPIDAGGASIPLGLYDSCSSAVVEGGRASLGPGGSLGLTQSDGRLTVEVGEGVFAVASGALTFAPINGDTAVIVPGQTYGTRNVDCTTSTITAGALALAGDTLLVSLLGQGCQDGISGTLRCTVPTDVTGTVQPPKPCASATADACMCGAADSDFPLGVYGACAGTYTGSGSILGYSGGQIAITESRGALMVALDGITGPASMKASLQFGPTTGRTAEIAPGQHWVVSVPGASVLASATMTITSGSLVVDGSTLFAFLAGSDESGEIQESFHCTAGP